MANEQLSALPTRRAPWWLRAILPYVLLLNMLVLTAVISLYVWETTQTHDRLRFGSAVQGVEQSIVGRLNSYVAILLGARGLLAAVPEPDPAQFRQFVAQFDLAARYPGTEGVGLSVRLLPDERAAFEERMRAAGLAEFQVWPPDPRTEYHTIAFLEPVDAYNQRAIGYDMFTEATRRAAMEQARDSGEPVMSGKVTLVQETEVSQQAGFLLYVPVYRGGIVPETVAARRETLVGFLYIPFRVDDLLARILGQSADPTIDLEVYDGATAAPAALMHRSAGGGGTPERARFRTTETIQVAEHPWTLVFYTRPAFDRLSNTNLVPWLALSGISVSLVIFGISLAQVRARAAAEGHAAELYRSEEALEASATRFRTLVEQSPFSIQILDPTGKTVEVNRAWEELWGITLAQMAGYNMLQDRQLDAEGILPLIQQGFAGTATAIPPVAYAPDRGSRMGEPHWVKATIYPVKDEQGRIREVVLVHEDVSERQQAALALNLLAEAGAALAATLDYEETLQILVATVVPALADYALLLVLEEGLILRPVAMAHVDPAKLPFLAATTRYYEQPYDQASNLFERVLRTGEPLLLSNVPSDMVTRYTQDKTIVEALRSLGPCSLLLVPLVARGRTLGGLLMAYSDSGRRYNEGDLHLAQELVRRAGLAVDNARLYREAQEAIQIRDQFLSIASHDLKTPITAIQGYAELLLRRAAREPELNPRLVQFLQVIREEAGRLTQLVELLLDSSRIQSGHLLIERELVDLGALAARVTTVMQATWERHTLELRLPDTPLRLLGDELRLEQVLHNLLQNAVKYSPAGGTVWLTLARRGTQARLEVRDEGIGIPPEALPQLFDRFYRAPNVQTLGTGGQGLGLFIVRYLVEAHSGTVHATSTPGAGSTFTVELPLITTAQNGER